MQTNYIDGSVNIAMGNVPRVSTTLDRIDVWETIKVRWSVGRMSYTVKPGLYATGNPGDNSDMFVTGNFKLSFDHLRRSLSGINAWILVLDTKGINVWCAAGKGTFGTAELVRMIRRNKLDELLTHRKIIVPQLGATGVCAHEVRNQTGFHVIYGPVRAEDIPAFVASGYKATSEMRKVRFSFADRIILIPVEIAINLKYLLFALALMFILSGLNIHGYSIDMAWEKGSIALINILSGYIAGCALTPSLLPWIPFRRFAVKGFITGLFTSIVLFYFHFLGETVIEKISWVLIICGISSFLAMNFTGSSTYTSLSGVKKEMKTALPLQIVFTALGLMAWIVTRFT